MAKIPRIPSKLVLKLIDKKESAIPAEIRVDARYQDFRFTYEHHLHEYSEHCGAATFVMDCFDDSSGQWIATPDLLTRWSISREELKNVILESGLPIWLVKHEAQIAVRMPREKLDSLANLSWFPIATQPESCIFSRFDDVSYLEKVLELRNTGTGYWLTSVEIQERWSITKDDLEILLRHQVPHGLVLDPHKGLLVWDVWSWSQLPTLFRTRHIHSLELAKLASHRFKAHQMEKRHCIDHAYRLHDERPELWLDQAADELERIPPMTGTRLAKIREWIAPLALFPVRKIFGRRRGSGDSYKRFRRPKSWL